MRAAGMLWLSAAATAWLATSAEADTLWLTDGTSRSGKVREQGGKVVLEVPNGSISFDRGDVVRVEYGDSPLAVLSSRRQQLSPRDARSRVALAEWAKARDLPDSARELLEEAVAVEPDNPAANLALGRLFIDGAWRSGPDLVDRLRQWHELGLHESAASGSRLAMAGMITDSQRRQLLELAADAARRCGAFTQARIDCLQLADLLGNNDPQQQKSLVIADILADNPAGLYPADAAPGLTGEDEPAAPPGYRSLADDAVLDGALRDRAREFILLGQAELAKANALAVTDPRRALNSYRQTEEIFARADAVKLNIARSYLVEIRRRMIRIHQSQAVGLAQEIDVMNRRLKAALGSDRQYLREIQRILPLLDEVEMELREILRLAAPYYDEFGVSIAGADEDLLTVQVVRRTLRGELERLRG